jgi:nitrite reductase/ring-hydroxylating ferredoxin subunit
MAANPSVAVTPTGDAAQFQRGERIAIQNAENGYFQCWYPLAVSSEVAPGQVVGREFLNGRVVVFRGQDGVPHVMSAFCRHLGADLALASVVGNDLRCVYHHWTYDAGGACVRTAAGDPPPRNARLFRFPTAEKYGLIWAFNGLEPLYDVPDCGLPESDLVVRAKEKEVLPVEPYVPFSNALDLQHLKVVHQLEIIKLPEKFDTGGQMIEYDIEFIAPMLGRGVQHVKMYGANSIIIRQAFMGREVYMMSFGRIAPGGRTVLYNVVATRKSSGKPGEDQMIAQILNGAEQFGDRLQDEDRPVMHTMSFRRDCLSASDTFMAAYLRFVQASPRTNVACDMVGP